KELKTEFIMVSTLTGIGSIYSLKIDYAPAIEFYRQGAELADSIGALNEASGAHKALSEIYERTGQFQNAFDHYKLYNTLKDSTFNEEKSKDLGKLEAKHEMEMANAERKRTEQEQARILEEKINRRNLLQYSGALIFIVALLIAITFSGRLNTPIRLAEGIIFFTFLLLFEFILVYLDPYVDNWTGGEPAYKLIINAGLAGLIFPLHSFFEIKMKQRMFKTK
ncbi:MAG: hypothetical protein JKX73_10430, partial [Flavobacteriales bacterium]|nr:hypothetical protein [Flavobacteriales bacterium]